MALKLVVTTNTDGDVFELPLKKAKYRVGRRHDNDLRIKETYISGYHSELNRNSDGEYELSDAGSSNGTFLNVRRVEGTAVVKAGDFIKFGILKVAVEEGEAAGPKVVSLKDRPAFAKKRNEMTAAIAAAGNTGAIASPDVISGPSEATGATPTVAPAELEKAEKLYNEAKKKAEALESSLEQEKATKEALSSELKALKKDASAATEVAPLQAKLKDSEAEAGKLKDEIQSLQTRLAEKEEALQAEIDPEMTFPSVESVGPKVSGELIQTAALAVVLAIAAVLIYIWLRFEWQFALGAVAALVHDVILTIGVFSELQIKFDLAIIAALLTIVGYSLNDTVVVFDRVRENLRKYKKRPLNEVLNISINETLSRTLMTSVTTLLALISLYVLGGDVIRGFVFAMIWGVIVGTYSSVFVASTILLWLGVKRNWDKQDPNVGNQYANIDD